MSKEQIKKIFESKEMHDVMKQNLNETVYEVLNILVQEMKRSKLDSVPLRTLENLRDSYSKKVDDGNSKGLRT
jgi:hypothetical protein